MGDKFVGMDCGEVGCVGSLLRRDDKIEGSDKIGLSDKLWVEDCVDLMVGMCLRQ